MRVTLSSMPERLLFYKPRGGSLGTKYPFFHWGIEAKVAEPNRFQRSPSLEGSGALGPLSNSCHAVRRSSSQTSTVQALQLRLALCAWPSVELSFPVRLALTGFTCTCLARVLFLLTNQPLLPKASGCPLHVTMKTSQRGGMVFNRSRKLILVKTF